MGKGLGRSPKVREFRGVDASEADVDCSIFQFFLQRGDLPER